LKNYLELFSLLTLERMATDFIEKNDKKYSCKVCDFISCKKTNFVIHCQTQKHLNNVLATSSNTDATKKKLKCEICNKVYHDRTGLWRHKTKGCCIKEEVIILNGQHTNDKDLVLFLIKENSDLKNIMMDQQNKMTELQTKMIEQQNALLEITKNET